MGASRGSRAPKGEDIQKEEERGRDGRGGGYVGKDGGDQRGRKERMVVIVVAAAAAAVVLLLLLLLLFATAALATQLFLNPFFYLSSNM